MDKKWYIIAGCNGAGKTTAFRRMLSSQLGDPIFVNPDVIARDIDNVHQWKARISAGRETLLQIDANIERGISFCVETTLTSKSYVQKINKAHEKGYQVDLYYYWLESADASYRRVLQRVEEGKHDSSVDNHMIPEDIIRRRYPKSIHNLLDVFIPIVDSWQVYDNNLGLALPIADKNEIYNQIVWNAIQRNDPEEIITSMNIDKLVDTIGIRRFSENVLRDKLKRNESVIYSIESRVEKFSPEDILWLYENFNRTLEDWEIEHLRGLAAKEKEQYYPNGFDFPASMVLKLYGIHA